MCISMFVIVSSLVNLICMPFLVNRICENRHAGTTGLAINSEGLLIDEKTGDVINEFGATRFDIAVHGAG